MTRYSQAFRFVTPYLAIALILLLPSWLQPNSNTQARIISATISETKTGPWQTADLERLKLTNNHAWLSVVFEIPSEYFADGAPPLGLYLSGSFSASVEWNGAPLETSELGHKGIPGLTKESENSGPIDAVIYLPNSQITPGNNTLLLELSSHYQPRLVSSIIHGQGPLFGIRVAPYSAEARRPIGYYSVPFLMLSVFAITALFLLRNKVPLQRIPVLLMVSLAFAAAFEISRAFYSYDYALHGFRLKAIYYALACFSALMLLYGLQLTTWWRKWIRLNTRQALWLSAGVILSYLFVADVFLLDRGLIAISALLCAALHLVAYKRTNKLEFIATSLAFVTLLVFALWDRGSFLDQNLYAASIALVATFFWPRTYEATDAAEQTNVTTIPAAQPTIRPESLLTVHQGHNKQFVQWEDIAVISGAGNYSEIQRIDGTTLLDDRGLKVLETKVPSQFFRIHRSHVVNLAQVARLETKTGGKHLLKLTNQTELPVSRNKIKELRELIAP